MENEKNCLLLKIKSNYILKHLLSYIKQKYFDLKLFSHSKLFQTKLNIPFSYYRMLYLIENGILSLENYLKYLYEDFFLGNEQFYKILSKYNINNDDNLKNFIEYYFTNELKDKISPDHLIDYKYIEVESAIFDFLEDKEILEKLFIIIIPIKYINMEIDYINKNKYISILNNSKNSSICFKLSNINEIVYLTNINYNFYNLKRLSIVQNYSEEINNYFIELLYPYLNINNLVYLHLSLYNEVDPNTFSSINNFISLVELKLSIKFKTIFTLDLYNLKKLTLNFCSNITFGDNFGQNLKELYLSYTEIKGKSKKFDFPHLQECRNNKISYDFNTIINRMDLRELKILESYISDYKLLDYSPIEKLYLKNYYESYGMEINMLSKIINNKTLQEVYVQLCKINTDKILEIEGVNTSVKNLGIDFRKSHYDYVKILRNKFPNVSQLIVSDFVYNFNDNKFLILNYNNKIYNDPLENLLYINFELDIIEKINKNTFPIFNDKCNVIFESLKVFRLKGTISFNILENIYNNLDNMPQLKKLILKIKIKYINKNFLKKFIEKVEDLKLAYAFLEFNRHEIDITNKKNLDLDEEIKNILKLKDLFFPPIILILKNLLYDYKIEIVFLFFLLIILYCFLKLIISFFKEI